MNSRQFYNIKIVLKLLNACSDPKNKDIRFGQLLTNLDILLYREGEPKDIYNDESSSIYKRICASVSH
jgi:hypothetical protein